MRHSNAMNDAEAKDASWEAGKGAAYGAVKWGAAAAVLSGVGFAVSPIYRGLTIQFKVYCQMSAMVMGGWIEADHRLRNFEARVRHQRRVMRDQALWKKFEEESGLDNDEGPDRSEKPRGP